MQFFVDTANIEQIKEAVSWGIVDGVTTNPTLLAKEKCDFKTQVKEILAITPGPVSIEVVALDAEGMVSQAKEYAAFGDNACIKIPMTKEGVKATAQLSELGIATNVTLLFSSAQALLAAKAGATYISPFLGRLDDIGHDGVELVADIREIYDMYGFGTQIIAASIRHPTHVLDCARVGAHVATVPFPVLDKLFNHPLTDKGVDAFLKDWEAVKQQCK